MDAQSISEWAAKGGKMRKGVGAGLTFFVRWICIENGLELVVDFFNAMASANTALGSPITFYIACAINLGMVALESVELCLTRKHGGKQSPWDRFLFGQWVDSTRKNYYVKYSARLFLGVHLFINATCLPSVIDNGVLALVGHDDDLGREGARLRHRVVLDP